MDRTVTFSAAGAEHTLFFPYRALRELEKVGIDAADVVAAATGVEVSKHEALMAAGLEAGRRRAGKRATAYTEDEVQDILDDLLFQDAQRLLTRAVVLSMTGEEPDFLKPEGGDDADEDDDADAKAGKDESPGTGD